MKSLSRIPLKKLEGEKMSNQELKSVVGGVLLPGVTITCGQYGGRCWYSDSDSHMCQFSGDQSHFCVYG